MADRQPYQGRQRINRSRFYQCDRKVQYASKQDAEDAINAIQGRDSTARLRTYQCKHCNGWHLARKKR